VKSIMDQKKGRELGKKEAMKPKRLSEPRILPLDKKKGKKDE